MVKFYIKTVTISQGLIIVDYEIILSKDNFEGAIGGGRTELPSTHFESVIDDLKLAIEAHIENTVGLVPIDKSAGSKKEEDPL